MNWRTRIISSFCHFVINGYHLWKDRHIRRFQIRLHEVITNYDGHPHHPVIRLLDTWLHQDPYHGWQLTKILISESNASVRVGILLAARWLQGFDARLYELLRQGLRDGDLRVRTAAARSLISLGSPQARKILRRHRDSLPLPLFLSQIELPFSEMPTAKIHRK
jgi:hypothetical protein